jgi:hypothetical protein
MHIRTCGKFPGVDVMMFFVFLIAVDLIPKRLGYACVFYLYTFIDSDQIEHMNSSENVGKPVYLNLMRMPPQTNMQCQASVILTGRAFEHWGNGKEVKALRSWESAW